jgi:hypothetical protein
MMFISKAWGGDEMRSREVWSNTPAVVGNMGISSDSLSLGKDLDYPDDIVPTLPSDCNLKWRQPLK